MKRGRRVYEGRIGVVMLNKVMKDEGSVINGKEESEEDVMEVT